MKPKTRPVQGGGVVGGIFGVVLGASSGVGFGSVVPPLWMPVGLALLFGVLGFFLGDRFWRWFSERAWWL